jgi:hypothetical protein
MTILLPSWNTGSTEHCGIRFYPILNYLSRIMQVWTSELGIIIPPRSYWQTRSLLSDLDRVPSCSNTWWGLAPLWRGMNTIQTKQKRFTECSPSMSRLLLIKQSSCFAALLIFSDLLFWSHTLMNQMSSNSSSSSSSSPCRLPAVPACLLDLDFLLRQTTTTMMIPAWLHLFV